MPSHLHSKVKWIVHATQFEMNIIIVQCVDA